MGLRRSITDRITTEEEPTNVRGVAVTNTILEIGVQPWEQLAISARRKATLGLSAFVATVSAAPEENRDQAGFLGAVTSKEEASWSVDIRLKRQIVPFKMDTGEEVTAINEGTYRSLGEPRLRDPTKVLWGPAHQTLDVMGQFMGLMKHGKRSARQSVYVVKGLKTNLLGLQAITALQLPCQIDVVGTEEPDVVKRFPRSSKASEQ